MTLKELSSRLYSLAVFRGLLRDPVMEALARCVRDCADLSNWDALGSYGEFVSRLYRAGGDLGRHIQRAVEQDENVCIRAAGRGEAEDSASVGGIDAGDAGTAASEERF